MCARQLEDYLKLPYSIEVFPDTDEDDPGWYARVIELPGCMTNAGTFSELGEMIEDAKRAWLTVALERGIPIPEPRQEEEYSGKFVTRIPKSLHRRLAQQAEREGISLNQYVNSALAEALGQDRGMERFFQYQADQIRELQKEIAQLRLVIQQAGMLSANKLTAVPETGPSIFGGSVQEVSEQEYKAKYGEWLNKTLLGELADASLKSVPRQRTQNE